MKHLLRLLSLLLPGLCALAAKPTTPLDLTTEQSGLKVLEAYAGEPDPRGIFETYELALPEYEEALYYRGTWWPYGGNRVTGKAITTPDEGKEGGIFMLLKLKSGAFLAVLPLCGEMSYAFLAPENGQFRLKLATFGTAGIQGDQPLLSWAKSDSAYEACHTAWMQACDAPQIKGHMKARDEKVYPEVFKYLGWCSWEGYDKSITCDKMIAEMKGLEASPVPVRYLLVDDGHFSSKTLQPDKRSFPDGYKPLTDLRSENGIKWVGMWHALLGNNNAMPPESPPAIVDAMMGCHNDRWIPKPDAKSIETFMRYLVSASKRDDIDFVKVDFCGTLLSYAAGANKGSKRVTVPYPETAANAIANPSAMATLFSRIYQKVVAEEFKGLMNCNWHVPHFIFHSGENNVGRCSGDYAKGNLERAKEHLFASYNTIPWLGQVAWGDHDMFHSSDKFAGRMMAISKAMSGGPVYLSDKHEELVPEHVTPLCYEDGLLIRPLAPAAPLDDDLFMMREDEGLYRVVAPLPNRSAAFVLYNLHGDKEKDLVEFSGAITPEHYRSASGMIQPYPGKWELPAEGLLVYDHTTRKAVKLEQEYKVTLKGFSDRLLQLSPIQHGWSVIGRVDKYLPASTVEVVSCDADELKIKLHESGPFAIWTEQGVPQAEGIRFTDHGDGLFVADCEVKSEPMELAITLK